MMGALKIRLLNVCRQEESLQDVLASLYVPTDPDNQVDVIVRRKKLWSSTQLALTNTDLMKTPKIHFSGEDGVDEGGPRREFFTYGKSFLNSC